MPASSASKRRFSAEELAQSSAKPFKIEPLKKDTPSVLEIIYQLNNSLEIPTVIQQLANFLAKMQLCDSLSYQHAEFNLAINIGQPAKHRFKTQLTYNEQTLGELSLTRAMPYTEINLAEIEDFLCWLVLPLRNAIFHQIAIDQARIDPLTGANNRSGMLAALKRDLSLARRHNWSLSLLALDLDHFKNINDSFGHLAGDAVLQSFASHVKKMLRDSDLFCRIGREEFIIILPKTDITGAIQLADGLRKVTAYSDHQFDETIIALTTSIGVATLVAGDTERTLLERVDKALYRAKQQGRNRVCI